MQGLWALGATGSHRSWGPSSYCGGPNEGAYRPVGLRGSLGLLLPLEPFKFRHFQHLTGQAKYFCRSHSASPLAQVCNMLVLTCRIFF